MSGLGAVDWVLLDHTAYDAIQVGDVVSTDAGGMPAYRVMALANGQAWLRDDDNCFDQILPLAGFQWKARF